MFFRDILYYYRQAWCLPIQTGGIMADRFKRNIQGVIGMQRLLSAALIFFSVFALSACSTVNSELQVSGSPGELYDTGMEAYVDYRYEEAERNFKGILEYHPLSPLALEAQLMLGDISFVTEKFDDASAYYTDFIAMHPTHPRAPYALFQKGMSHFRDVLTIDRDQTSTRKALFAFEDLLAGYPDSSYNETAKELVGFLKRRLADREFYIARFYFNGKNYKGALARFRDMLKNYPEVGLTDSALFYIGESYYELGETGLARETFTTLISDYPASPFVGDAKDRIKGG